jgi:hypothetical protein
MAKHGAIIVQGIIRFSATVAVNGSLTQLRLKAMFIANHAWRKTQPIATGAQNYF